MDKKLLNKKLWNKNIAKKLGEGAVVLALLFLLYGVWGCPIKRLTGIPCPGCGMTHAWINVLTLHWKTAYMYHPLWGLPVVFLLALFMKLRGHEKFFWSMVVIIVVLFLIVYAERMFTKWYLSCMM